MSVKRKNYKDIADNSKFLIAIFVILLIIIFAYIILSESARISETGTKLVLASAILFFLAFFNVATGNVGIGYYSIVYCDREEDPKTFWAIVAGEIILGIILLIKACI